MLIHTWALSAVGWGAGAELNNEILAKIEIMLINSIILENLV